MVLDLLDPSLVAFATYRLARDRDFLPNILPLLDLGRPRAIIGSRSDGRRYGVGSLGVGTLGAGSVCLLCDVGLSQRISE